MTSHFIRCCIRQGLGPLAAACALGAGTAFASTGGGNTPSEAVFLAQLIALMLVGRLLGEAMSRIGQPSVMGQLLAGILLGPSVLGALSPDFAHWLFPLGKEQKAMIDAVSQFGILLLLMLTGMETDLALVRKVGRAAVSISFTGVAVPFACGLALGLTMPESLLPDPGNRLLTALFLGTALSISSIKIVAAIVHEMGFTRRNLGQVIVSSAILEDTMGWIIVAITFGLAQAGHIDLTSIARSVLGTAAFLAASLTVGRRIVSHLIRFANDHFQSEFPVITTILVIMVAMALTTHFIGVHSVLGAFVAGVLIGESPILTRHIDEQLRGVIAAFFMPVFFGLAGLSADLTILQDPRLSLLALALIAIASVGKFAGAFIGGEIGGLTRRESFALACGMNARGSTEVIVATIGLSMGALSQDLFTMIVAMALVTTLAMPPMLRWGLARVPIRRDERERLEREELEAKGFVANVERLLMAVDESANGRFASRLAGLLASSRSIPITVVPLSAATAEEAAADQVEQVVKAAAEDSKRARTQRDGSDPIDVLIRTHDAPGAEAVAREAKRGYDLLFVGIAEARARDGGFHAEVSRIANSFDGPLAVVTAGTAHLRDPERSEVDILLPVNGTEVSRRAAEVAIAIAAATGRRLAALYVTTAATRNRPRRLARQEQLAVMKDIVGIAEHYGVKVKTAVQADTAPDRAIVAEARRAQNALIIMGVSRRPGNRLAFGDTAAVVLAHASNSVMFLAS